MPLLACATMFPAAPVGAAPCEPSCAAQQDQLTKRIKRQVRKGHPDRAHWLRHRRARVRLIAPYRWWLGSTGACESGGTARLDTGLTVVSSGGEFYGRYQFLPSTWYSVGGSGSPAAANWLEQAVRAVHLLRRSGHGQWPVCGH